MISFNELRKQAAARGFKDSPNPTRKQLEDFLLPFEKEVDPKEDNQKKALILRTCAKDMSSQKGFVWPRSGPVHCPDWKPLPHCGNGLHGALWGEGDGTLFSWDKDANWLVVEVLERDIIDLDGKVKFPKGTVVFCGDQKGATEYLYSNGGAGRAIIGGTATAGYRGTATAGYRGTATAGYRGTATAGDYGTATAGDYGTATAGDYGTATAGDYGTATAGNFGTATAGNFGTATAGYRGTATAGYRGILSIAWWDKDARRQRIMVAYVGEDGIEPNVAYKLDVNGKFIKA